MSVPQVASPDCLNLSDLLAVVQLSLQADLSVRLDICRQVSKEKSLGSWFYLSGMGVSLEAPTVKTLG